MKSLKVIFALTFVIMAISLKAQTQLGVLNPQRTCMTTPECGFEMCITSNYSHTDINSNNRCFLVEVISDGTAPIFMSSTNGYYWDFQSDDYVSAVICFQPDSRNDFTTGHQIFCGLKDPDTGENLCMDGCVVIIGDGG